MERWDPASFYEIAWHWPSQVMAPIGSVLRPRREKVDRSGFSFDELQPITLHFDGSIDRREIGAGREYKMDLFFARPGDIVVAKIDLKNGAVGIVPDWENVVVTGHFAVYQPDTSRLEPEYLIRLLQTSFFKAYLWRNKVGAEGRKEVKLDFFESILIPLPSLNVQRDLMGYWRQAKSRATSASRSAELLETQLTEHILAEAGINVKPLAKKPKAYAANLRDLDRWGVEFNRWAWSLQDLLSSEKHPTARLATVASINPPVIHQLSDDDQVTFVPMASVSDLSGEITSPELRPYGDVKRGYTRFSESDVIWAKITPCMQNGKCAVARELENGVGCGSTEFHVVRVKDTGNLLPDYVWLLLRLNRVRDAAQRYFIGSAGQQRVPAEFLAELHIPIPPIELQYEILERIQQGFEEVARFRAVADQTHAAVEAEVEAMILGTMPIPMQ